MKQHLLLYCCVCMMYCSRTFAQNVQDLSLNCPCKIIDVAGQVLIDGKIIKKGQKIFPDQKIQFVTKGNAVVLNDARSNSFLMMPLDFIPKSKAKCENCTPMLQVYSDRVVDKVLD